MTKTWLITGASSGLGRLLTEKLLARGDRVVATLRREGALSELQARYGDRLHAKILELTDTSAVHAVVRQSFAEAGRIDVVVSNAGYGLFGAAEEVTDAQIDRQIATNLIGSIQLIRASLTLLREQGGGRIMQVSSEGGQVAYPNFSLYHATKWGIEGFIESVSQEVAPFGIDFVIVEPGATATKFGSNLDHAAPMTVYDDTPAGFVRKAVASGTFAIRGDAAKTVDAMILAADAASPALRLSLGGGVFDRISAALSRRLRALEDQKAAAFSVDVDS